MKHYGLGYRMPTPPQVQFELVPRYVYNYFMLKRLSVTDIETVCGTCNVVIFVPANEWNRKKKTSDIPRVYCSLRCSSVKKKSYVTEDRLCHCGSTFTVTYRTDGKGYVRKTCSKSCSAKRQLSAKTKAMISTSVHAAYVRNPENCMKGIRAMIESSKTRSSSKAERTLAEALRPFGFKRHKHITVDELTFDIDIISNDGHVWIESDGEWHFRQVHAGHNFEATKFRDALEEKEAINRGVLLVRVNNQTTTVEEQVSFIQTSISSWTGGGKVLRFGYD